MSANNTSATPSHSSTSAATDVAEFLTDLDGGQFERMISIAVSEVAAGTCDNDGKDQVIIKLDFTKVPGASQVICSHALKFSRPTSNGKRSEECSNKTSLHVGKFGKLTLMPESQIAMFTRDGQPNTTQQQPPSA